MQRVVINMQSNMNADFLKRTMEKGGDIHADVVREPSDAVCRCYTYAATVFLMEITSSPYWTVANRLQSMETVKRKCPYCKMVFLVDENAEKEISEQVKQAKHDGQIDEFIYSSTSAKYLIGLIDSL